MPVCRTVTTGLWARGILQSEYSVDLNKVTWVPTDDEHVLGFQYPPNVDNSCRGKPGGLICKQPHPCRRTREPAPDIEGARVKLWRIVLRRRRHVRKAALDAGFFGHAPEDSALTAIIRKQRLGEANKTCVHIVWRYRSHYTVDVGGHPEPLNFTFAFQINTSGTPTIRFRL